MTAKRSVPRPCGLCGTAKKVGVGFGQGGAARGAGEEGTGEGGTDGLKCGRCLRSITGFPGARAPSPAD